MTFPASLRDSAPGRQVSRVGNFTLDAARALRDRRTWGPLLLDQMRRLGVESVPIALFIALFTGIVLALLSKYIFTGAVPIYFVGTLVGKAIMLELGPVLTGMALAGRVGANIAAEIGTMRVTEQVDALETLAYDKHAYLVVPRVLAGTLMFPVVTALRRGPRRLRRMISPRSTCSTFPAPSSSRGCRSSTSSRTSGTASSRRPASGPP